MCRLFLLSVTQAEKKKNSKPKSVPLTWDSCSVALLNLHMNLPPRLVCWVLLSSPYVWNTKDVYHLPTSHIIKTFLMLNECSDRFVNDLNRKYYFGHLPVSWSSLRTISKKPKLFNEYYSCASKYFWLWWPWVILIHKTEWWTQDATCPWSWVRWMLCGVFS